MTVRQRLPSYPDPIVRPNAVCPYYTMFPLAFPWRLLASANEGATVLDPFCGRGTTNYAARLHGLTSVGVDSNPVAVAIARSKLHNVRPSSLVARCKELLESRPTDMPNGEFWAMAYHPRTLDQICRVREGLPAQSSTPTDNVLTALLLGILHGPLTKSQASYLSNQMPRTYATKPAAAVRYWTTRHMTPPRVELVDLVRRRAEYTFAAQPNAGTGAVVLGDSIEASFDHGQGQFDYVITSPPYFGMYTYYPDQWLRAWFLGGPAVPTERGSVQLGQGSREQFVDKLARVWRRVAAVCRPKARMVVRFGSLPSAAVTPRAMIRQSVELADAGWQITRVAAAGGSDRGRRQSDQFLTSQSVAVTEVDLYARLVQ